MAMKGGVWIFNGTYQIRYGAERTSASAPQPALLPLPIARDPPTAEHPKLVFQLPRISIGQRPATEK